MSVSLDPVEDKEKALKFLTQVGSALPNYLLDEPGEFWEKRWDMRGPPAYFVFDRAGRRAGKFVSGDKLSKDESYPAFTQEDIEKLVLELLKAK